MANATENLVDKYRPSGGPHARLPMAVESIPYGAVVMINAAGFVANGADAAGATYLGIAIEAIDNSGGSAGDERILVDIGGAIVRIGHATGSLTVANVGDRVNVEFNNEGDDATSTNDIQMGKILEVIGAADIWVKTQSFDGPPV